MIGIFGGSFDPIHFGHIKSILALLEHYNFDHVRLIPCQQSPLKDKIYASAQQRWDMLNLVTRSNEKLIADARELKRQGPSYTIDTLREIRGEFGLQTSLVLIIGIDAFLNFCKWYKYDEILSLGHIMLLQRPGYILPNSGCENELFNEHVTDEIDHISNAANGKIYLSNEEKIEISSTIIRQCISESRQPKYMLPGTVWNYIIRNNLYK